jgi:hypothetical protein
LVAKSQGLVLENPKVPVPKGASFAEFNWKRRPVSFNLAYLINLHREKFSDLKAVYLKAPDPKDSKSPKKGYAAVFAALCLQRDDLSVADVIEAYTSHGTGGKSAADDLRRNIEMAISESSTLDSKALLSDEAYRSQPCVAASGVAPYLLRFPTLDIDRQIARAYSKGVKRMRFLQDEQDCDSYIAGQRRKIRRQASRSRP